MKTTRFTADLIQAIKATYPWPQPKTMPLDWDAGIKKLLQRQAQGVGHHRRRAGLGLLGCGQGLVKECPLRRHFFGCDFLAQNGLFGGLVCLPQEQRDLRLIVSARIRMFRAGGLPALGHVPSGTGRVAREQVITGGLVALNTADQGR